MPANNTVLKTRESPTRTGTLQWPLPIWISYGVAMLLWCWVPPFDDHHHANLGLVFPSSSSQCRYGYSSWKIDSGSPRESSSMRLRWIRAAEFPAFASPSSRVHFMALSSQETISKNHITSRHFRWTTRVRRFEVVEMPVFSLCFAFVYTRSPHRKKEAPGASTPSIEFGCCRSACYTS